MSGSDDPMEGVVVAVQQGVEGDVDFCSCRSTSDAHTLGCIMEQMRRRKAGTPAQAKREDGFLGEIVGYATEEGIRPVTRAKLYELCIERGETPAEADASAFGPWTRPLRGDEPGIITDAEEATCRA